MLNKLLFTAAVFPGFLFGNMESLRKDMHFKFYEELITYHQYGTSEYWMSVGRAQAYSDVIVSIDLELMEMDVE